MVGYKMRISTLTMLLRKDGGRGSETSGRQVVTTENLDTEETRQRKTNEKQSDCRETGRLFEDCRETST